MVVTSFRVVFIEEFEGFGGSIWGRGGGVEEKKIGYWEFCVGKWRQVEKNQLPTYVLKEWGQKEYLHTEDCGVVEELRSNHQKYIISQPFLFLGLLEM